MVGIRTLAPVNTLGDFATFCSAWANIEARSKSSDAAFSSPDFCADAAANSATWADVGALPFSSATLLEDGSY